MKQKWFPALSVSFGLGCLHLLTGASVETGRQFIWLPLLALAWAGAKFFWQRDDKRLKTSFGIMGGLFVMFFALNLRLEAMDRTGWDGLALCALCGLCLGASAAEGFIRVFEALGRLREPIGWSVRKAFWVSFAVVLLCWLPVLLACYPGITGYDIDNQAYQIYTGDYNTHHPLLHTLFLQLFMELGKWLMNDYSFGYGLHTIAQHVLLALAMAYSLRWLARVRCPRVLWFGTLIFFALSPQNAMLASSGIKDVLFSAVMLVLAVEMVRFLTETERENKKSAWIINILLTALACMLRNNTVYGLVLLVPLCALVWRKQLGLRVLAVVLAGMLVGTAGAAGLKTATDAKEGSVREKLFVPCQQLARVYFVYELDHPVGYECREVMPFVEDYTPERADAVKRQAVVDTPDRLIRFLKLWVREAFHYPIEYIDALLLNTKAYWALDDVSFATTYDETEPRGCLLMWHNTNTQLEIQNLWPQVKDFCYRMFVLNEYQRFPVLWTLLHPAFYTWLLVFVMIRSLLCRQKGILFASGILASYLLTLLLGPCVLIRYSYYLMLALPVLLGASYANHTQEVIKRV